jgi:hypothetical protein
LSHRSLTVAVPLPGGSTEPDREGAVFAFFASVPIRALIDPRAYFPALNRFSASCQFTTFHQALR